MVYIYLIDYYFERGREFPVLKSINGLRKKQQQNEQTEIIEEINIHTSTINEIKNFFFSFSIQ